MTARELADLLDKEATFTPLPKVPTWSVQVKIVDARESFGSMQVLVEPVSGSGRAWVDAGRVAITGGTT